MSDSIINNAKGMLTGLAVGDALGMVCEFEQPGTFPYVDEMRAGGPFNLPKGYWTDDTSMALCLAESLLNNGGYDSYDVMGNFTQWRNEGYLSSTGFCFDCGGRLFVILKAIKVLGLLKILHALKLLAMVQLCD